MKEIFSERPFIGVRIPKIREIVRRVPKDKISEFIKVEPIAIEEVLARGMLICRLNYTDNVFLQPVLSQNGSFFPED